MGPTRMERTARHTITTRMGPPRHTARAITAVHTRAPATAARRTHTTPATTAACTPARVITAAHTRARRTTAAPTRTAPQVVAMATVTDQAARTASRANRRAQSAARRLTLTERRAH